MLKSKYLSSRYSYITKD